MNQNLGTVNYTTHFKYKTPTPIRDTPTHWALKRLLAKLHADTSSIECDLGGGDHGYSTKLLAVKLVLLFTRKEKGNVLWITQILILMCLFGIMQVIRRRDPPPSPGMKSLLYMTWGGLKVFHYVSSLDWVGPVGFRGKTYYEVNLAVKRM